MCGITGFWSRRPPLRDPSALVPMLAAIAHRGPDDSGSYVENGLALGHRRLAIVDLSADGRQPMRSASGRYLIVFNGEIYNFVELRERLAREGRRFATRSDTEVMLQAFEAWGVEDALRAFAGMFAFALWDSEREELWLARDRLGKKPLYVELREKEVAFASELRCIETLSRHEVARGSLALLLRNSYIPQPYTILEGVQKLPPASAMCVPRDGAPRVVTYWSLDNVARAPRRLLGDREAVDRLAEILDRAVSERMVVDVPLGAFLSGGIDSSLVVSLMRSHSPAPVRTFTIGFAESEYDEAKHAKRVAEHLGTLHTERYVTPEDALAVIPRLMRIYDEPFADSSQIPTFLVSEMARRHVTVALSGDGGDEVFGGYNRYLYANRLWRRMARIPRPLRSLAGRGVLALPASGWDTLYRAIAPLLRPRSRLALPGEKAHKLGEALDASSRSALYLQFTRCWRDPERAVPGAQLPPTLLDEIGRRPAPADYREEMMLLDSLTYLPDDILVKVDRASMAVALEARAPLLDHRVVEYAWSLPIEQKIRDGQGKWLLRQLLDRHVPRSLIERPKMGFGVPIAEWLRGPLRDWAGALLDEDRLRREGYFDVAEVRTRWRDHLAGRRNWQAQLWAVLMFQLWLDERPDAMPPLAPMTASA